MRDHLTHPQSNVFKSVHALIYIFSLETESLDNDKGYFRDCIHKLFEDTPPPSWTPSPIRGGGSGSDWDGPKIFLLLHKFDLVKDTPTGQRKIQLDARAKQVESWVNEFLLEVAERWNRGRKEVKLERHLVGIWFTSIWDDSLYDAWSSITTALIPNITLIRSSLSSLARSCGAHEVVVFEKSTWLTVCRVDSILDEHGRSRRRTEQDFDQTIDNVDETEHRKKYEKISHAIKAFRGAANKHSQMNDASVFSSITLRQPGMFSLVIDDLTEEMKVLVICPDDSEHPVDPALVSNLVAKSRPHFKALQSGSVARDPGHILRV